MVPQNEIEFFTNVRALYDKHLGAGNVPNPENVWNGDELAFGRGEWPVRLVVAHLAKLVLHERRGVTEGEPEGYAPRRRALGRDAG